MRRSRVVSTRNSTRDSIYVSIKGSIRVSIVTSNSSPKCISNSVSLPLQLAGIVDELAILHLQNVLLKAKCVTNVTKWIILRRFAAPTVSDKLNILSQAMK